MPFTGVGLFLDTGFVVTDWLMRPIFGLVGLVLVAAGLYVGLKTLDVRVGNGRLVRERRWCGMLMRRDEVPARDIAGFEIERGFSVTQGTKQIQYFRLVARTAGGNVQLGDGIADYVMVETIRDALAARMGAAQTA